MRLLSQLSIRVRLTIGTLILALFFFVLTAVIMHALVRNLMEDSTASLLASDIAPYEAAIQNEPNDEADIPAEGQLIAVIDPTKNEHVSSLPTALRKQLGELTTLPSGNQEVVVGGSSYLVTVEQVKDSSGEWTIVAARDQSTTELVMSRLTVGIIIGLAVLVILFGLVSWFLIGTALRPVERLRRSAEQIVSTGSDDLLPVSPAKDEIQQLAGTLNHLIADLRSSVARERQMVSDASHELRTPLAVLQGQLELLRTGDRSTIDEDIASAERATARLSRLATDLLELSRLESSSASRASSELADLVDEAGEAVDRARLAYSDRDIDVEFAIQDLPEWGAVAIRETTFGQVVDNLINNAANAIVETGRIEVVLEADDEAVVLTVVDSGPGIPEDFIPLAFDRFSRADESRGQSIGAGLGLAIVAAAVGAAGGDVELANQPVGGLCATVRLPITFSPRPKDDRKTP